MSAAKVEEKEEEEGEVEDEDKEEKKKEEVSIHTSVSQACRARGVDMSFLPVVTNLQLIHNLYYPPSLAASPSPSLRLSVSPSLCLFFSLNGSCNASLSHALLQHYLKRQK